MPDQGAIMYIAVSPAMITTIVQIITRLAKITYITAVQLLLRDSRADTTVHAITLHITVHTATDLTGAVAN